MNEQQLTALLAYAGRWDSRVRRSLADAQQAARTIAEWTTTLAYVPATVAATGWDAARAVDHYYERHKGDQSARFRAIEPHDILASWAPHRSELMQRHTDPLPAADPDDAEAWREELLRTRGAVALGLTPPSEYRAEIDPAGQKRLASLLSGVGEGPRRYVPDHIARQLAPHRPGRAHRQALVDEGVPDPYSVACPHCHAPADHPCQGGFRRHGKGRRSLGTVHDSRIQALIAQLDVTQEEAEVERRRLAALMCQPPTPRETRARHTTGGHRR